jgi:hypothetical protein
MIYQNALRRSRLSLEIHEPHQKLEPQQAAMVSPPTLQLEEGTLEGLTLAAD